MPLTCVGYSSGSPASFSGELDLPSRYLDIDHIGQGASCVVVKAHDKFLDRQVAIKVMKSELTDFNSIRRFQQEAKMMSSFNLKNLPVVLDFGLSSSGRPFMVMELVEGLSLKRTIEEKTWRLGVELALEITIQILSALQHAHERGIVHRDLKSQNVMVSWTQHGKPLIKVVDFGLAGELNQSGSITECGTALGTPYYMSPEQARGCSADTRSDLYSLGCVMFEMLTGHTPFEKPNAAETLGAHIRETAPALTAIANFNKVETATLRSLELAVAKLLEKDPEKRYQCASDLREELVVVLERMQTITADRSKVSVDEEIESSLARFSSWTNIRPIQTNEGMSLQSGHSRETGASTCDLTYRQSESLHEIAATSQSKQLLLILSVMALLILSAVGVNFLEPTPSVFAKPLTVPIVDTTNPIVKMEREANAQLSEEASDLTKRTFKATIGGKFHISQADLWALPSLADQDLVLIKDFPTVRNLNLITSQGVTGEGFHQIKTLPIESLDLRGMTISQSGFDAISEMRSLKTLQIDYMPFLTLSKISKLRSAPALKTLTCRGAHLSSRCQSEIARMPHLTQLFLTNTSGLNDSSLELFAKIPTLKSLSIGNTSDISAEAIAQFKKLRPDVALDS